MTMKDATRMKAGVKNVLVDRLCPRIDRAALRGSYRGFEEVRFEVPVNLAVLAECEHPCCDATRGFCIGDGAGEPVRVIRRSDLRHVKTRARCLGGPRTMRPRQSHRVRIERP